MPRVSVLIPTWNRERYLGQAIESVLAQTYRDFEVIVVDDGSTDGTAALVRRYETVRYVYQPHSGIPAARNRALEEARGELIAWLDSDDMYEPEKLERQVEYLDSHPTCQIVFCLQRSFSDIADSEMTDRQRRLAAIYGDGVRVYLASACIRREVFTRYGGFEEKYAYGEDTEWIARICAAGVSVRTLLEERLYLCRIHDGQISYTHPPMVGRATLSIFADAIRRAKRREKSQC